MKKIFLFYILSFLAGIPAFSQDHYEVTTGKSGEKILKGILSREAVEQDTGFYKSWYAANFRAYTPNPDAVAGLKKYSDSIQIVAFMGTWCEDSHFVIPRLFHLLDEAGYGKEKLSLLGTDRAKKTLGNLSESMNVKNVPTIILMKNGIEIGRVVEYGKTGMFDKDIADILNQKR